MDDSVCSVDGCGRGPVKARGWCSGHYSRWQRNGAIEPEVPIKAEIATPSECPSVSKYTLGCRCDGCCEARRAYQREHRPKWLERIRSEPTPSEKHGTRAGYNVHKCRCDECREWARLDPGRRAYRGRRRARLRGAVSEPYDIVELHRRDRGVCALCRSAVDLGVAYPDPQSPSIDHIVPLAEGGDGEPANVQVVHLLCNQRKGTRGDSEQLRLVG